MRALFNTIKIQMNLYVMESERDPRPRKGPHPEEHSVNDTLWTRVCSSVGSPARLFISKMAERIHQCRLRI